MQDTVYCRLKEHEANFAEKGKSFWHKTIPDEEAIPGLKGKVLILFKDDYTDYDPEGECRKLKGRPES